MIITQFGTTCFNILDVKNSRQGEEKSKAADAIIPQNKNRFYGPHNAGENCDYVNPIYGCTLMNAGVCSVLHDFHQDFIFTRYFCVRVYVRMNRNNGFDKKRTGDKAHEKKSYCINNSGGNNGFLLITGNIVGRKRENKQ